MTRAQIEKQTSYDVIYESDPWGGKKIEPSSQTSVFSVSDVWSSYLPPVPPPDDKSCDDPEIIDRPYGVSFLHRIDKLAMELENANLLIADQNRTIAYLRGFIEARIPSSSLLAPSLETMCEQIINLQLRMANIEVKTGEHGEKQLAHNVKFDGNAGEDRVITRAATEALSTKSRSIKRNILEDVRTDYMNFDCDACNCDVEDDKSSDSETDDGRTAEQSENQIHDCTFAYGPAGSWGSNYMDSRSGSSETEACDGENGRFDDEEVPETGGYGNGETRNSDVSQYEDMGRGRFGRKIRGSGSNCRYAARDSIPSGMGAGRGATLVASEGIHDSITENLLKTQLGNPTIESDEVGWCLLNDCVRVVVHRLDSEVDNYRIKLSTPLSIFMRSEFKYLCSGRAIARNSTGQTLGWKGRVEVHESLVSDEITKAEEKVTSDVI